jgi:23S rRNA (cytosine1962-C5)-methyltransferase
MNLPRADRHPECAGQMPRVEARRQPEDTAPPGRRPLILFEDDDLLVVNKPAGLNTHAPAPFAGEGLYDWLRHREPRWATLAIIHRLDKETSGVMVFARTPRANRSLTAQFTRHAVRKGYCLLTDRMPSRASCTVVSALARVGARYQSRPLPAGGQRAETRFRILGRQGAHTLLRAEPLTGRTHQIRVHAAAEGFPVLGDTLYGGSPAPRLCLHAEALTLRHPADGREMTFRVPADFDADPHLALRAALFSEAETTAVRLIHGAADGWPGWQVDRLGDYLLSQAEAPLTPRQRGQLECLWRGDWPGSAGPLRGAFHKRLARDAARLEIAEASPRLVLGQGPPAGAAASVVVCENGRSFELRFDEGGSVGLFLDQRDNRRRFLINHVAAGFPLFPAGAAGREVLNTFAYTCGFSVCAARAGARTVSLDLSAKYLDWGRRNFTLNGLDPAEHDFVRGDVWDWLRRWRRTGRRFDALVLDPPTFSRSKAGGAFAAEKDYAALVAASLPLLQPEGVLLASCNAARVRPEDFLARVEAALAAGARRVLQRHYAPQPPDFPVTREQPAHLKTVWLRIG